MLGTDMIKTDRHVTYHELRASLGISIGQIQSILRKYLSMEKLCSRWIPHNLNDASNNRPHHLEQCHAYQIQRRGVKFGVGLVTSDEISIYYYDPKTKLIDQMGISR
ncbi:hypothetical protein EVAR_81080_1 [Eumeta japonica]|uniref:Histone-lysine N-methyltransferase SETMAR n=1 Tax=Eumeta variegata TaxID=151549 RepID=A0A4C1T8J3_EUMVA|nr:hypothetical protein EVAR_81080_1 [Eumeta japonica]